MNELYLLAFKLSGPKGAKKFIFTQEEVKYTSTNTSKFMSDLNIVLGGSYRHQLKLSCLTGLCWCGPHLTVVRAAYALRT